MEIDSQIRLGHLLLSVNHFIKHDLQLYAKHSALGQLYVDLFCISLYS